MFRKVRNKYFPFLLWKNLAIYADKKYNMLTILREVDTLEKIFCTDAFCSDHSRFASVPDGQSCGNL